MWDGYARRDDCLMMRDAKLHLSRGHERSAMPRCQIRGQQHSFHYYWKQQAANKGKISPCWIQVVARKRTGKDRVMPMDDLRKLIAVVQATSTFSGTYYLI
jgi:hypothetical protein